MKNSKKVSKSVTRKVGVGVCKMKILKLFHPLGY
jgi:hypothetical protein